MDKIDTLLQKEITRREFLGLVAAAFLSVIGVSALIKNFTGMLDRKTGSPTDLGYGDSAYGGSRPGSTL